MKITYTALALCIISMLGMAGCGASQQADAVSVLHHFKTGNEAYRIEDYRRAIIHFSRALELNPQSPDIQYNLGLAHYRAGNYKDAVTAFSAALRARPSMGDAHYNLALAHDRLFNADAAHTHYNKYRSMMLAQPSGNSPQANTSQANTQLGASSARIPAIGKRRGSMVNGSTAPNNAAGLSQGGRVPAAGNRSVASNSPVPMRGRPIPKVQRPLNGVPPAGARKQSGAPRASVKSRLAARPAPNTRAAAQASQQNIQKPSGDKQKWWIQDRLNRTR